MPACWSRPRCLETFCWVVPTTRGQLEHRRLAFAQPVEELDPRRLGERAEALGDQLDQLVGERVHDADVSVPSVYV